MTAYPRRIVCLAAEVPEILDRLGVFNRVIAVSGFARHPTAVKGLPKVGGFSTPDIEKIVAMSPDLVITISDIQAATAAALIKRGIPVLALNPHRLDDIWHNILLLGGILGVQDTAHHVVQTLQAAFHALRAPFPAGVRPRVYFEEWYDPLVSGIGWVSDVIEGVGGEDIFRDLATRPVAPERLVTAEAVIARQPDIIIASWRGKPADLDAIRQRPGWHTIPAVAAGQVYEIASEDLLQTGPSILNGARIVRNLLERVALSTATGSTVLTSLHRISIIIKPLLMPRGWRTWL